MAKVTSMPDGVDFDVAAEETVLQAAERAGVPLAHACGGRAKCSTCRVRVTEGLAACSPRTAAEASMAERLGFADEVRLACQLKPDGALQVHRLGLDETDLMMFSQLDREVTTRAGEAKTVTVLFSDIVDSTSMSGQLPPYDLLYVLNKYFVQVGDIIERNGGFIDRFVGDNVMAIFGLDGDADAPLRAVQTALRILDVADQMKPFCASTYGIDFDIRIGLHYGEAVIGALGSISHERLTAIGEVPNVASRIEAANKETQTRFLISQPVYEQVEESVEVADFVRVLLRGTSERITLYEIAGLKPEAEALLTAGEARETVLFAGKKWVRLFAEDELADGEWRLVPMDDYDAVVVRREEGYYAFNNACPHLHFPLFNPRTPAAAEISRNAQPGSPATRDSTFTDDAGVVCRWHDSCFDLHTGEVRDWAAKLQEDGTSPGAEYLGDISKNRAKLKLYTCRVHDGFVWIAPD